MTTKRETVTLKNINYVYNSMNEIMAVQIPYNVYLNLISSKKNALTANTVSESEVGFEILRASIKELQEKGMTLEQIASGLDVKQPYLSKLLRTKRQLKPDTISKYLKKLDSIG